MFVAKYMRQINILLTLDIHERIENFPTVVKIGPINSYRKRLSEILDASLYIHTLEGRIPRVFLDASPPRGYVYPRGHRHISNARSRAFQRRSVPWRTPAHETPNGREPSHLCDLRPRFKTAVCALAFPRVVEPG